MDNRLTLAAAAALVVAVSGGCSSSKQGLEVTDPAPVAVDMVVPEASVVPRAVIYRTSAPSDSLVPVTVRDGVLVSFPAPSDLGDAPVRLADGWLLDSRGVGVDTRFTRFTYDEYRSLPASPSPERILEAVDPSVTVTGIVVLPVAAGAVTPAQADELIRAGFPGCKVIK